LVVVRTFLVSKEFANGICWHVQRWLAEADSHYAQAQALTILKAVTIINSGNPNTDAHREYAAADAVYRRVATAYSRYPTLQAYARLALAQVQFDWLQDWTSARSLAQEAARTYEEEGGPYGAARARAIEADARRAVIGSLGPCPTMVCGL
jgi:drug/metabolite transporter superfamily protein YnfA